ASLRLELYGRALITWRNRTVARLAARRPGCTRKADSFDLRRTAAHRTPLRPARTERPHARDNRLGQRSIRAPCRTGKSRVAGSLALLRRDRASHASHLN